MDLDLNVRKEGDHSVLEVAGEIDVYTAPKLREQLIELVSDGSYHIVVDLEKVDFLDSTELWIGKTLVSPVILKILRIFSWVQTSWSEPSWLRTRLSPPTSTPSPVESRKSTFSRSTTMS